METVFNAKSTAIHMGGVSRYFSKASGSRVDVTLLAMIGFSLFFHTPGGESLESHPLEFDIRAELKVTHLR